MTSELSNGPGRLAVITAVRDCLTLTAAFLVDLFRTVPGAQIIMVDNNSGPEMTAFLETMIIRGVRVIADPIDNIAHCWNTGISALDPDVARVVVANNDIVLPDLWCQNMARAGLELNAQVIVPLSNFAGAVQMVKRQKDGTAAPDPRPPFLTNQPVSGFFFMVARPFLEKIGPFWEGSNIGMYEDNDFYRRVRAAGGQVAVDTKTFVYHYGSQTLKARGIDTFKMFHENKKLYEQHLAEIKGENA